MPDDGTEFAALVERFARLGPADRKAVRARLTAAEREALDGKCAQWAGGPATQRRFRGYSAWLADLIQRCLEEGQEVAELTPGCRSAVARLHAAGAGGEPPEPALRRALRLLGIAGSDAADRAGPPC